MRLSSTLFAARALPNDSDVVRIAVSAPRSFGRAVRRNRTRRRVREAFRAAIGDIESSSGCDLVVVARGPASSAAFGDLRTAAATTLAAITRRPVTAR
jgi:ribonuclease P protein component